ncbi:MAG: D-alanine--D-alanine ligase A [Chloroflexi bacterium RBG_16_68_14]|nr:MAG: D-alanine--D-alanine ligase A [Chloroflexi bacterium RBG_16_68_14]
MAERLPRRVGVIFGGQSGEHEVSVVSAQYVMAAARDRFQVMPIGVTRTGAWLTPEETERQLEREDAAFHKTLELPGAGEPALSGAKGLLSRPEALASLREIDVAFPLIHGPFGEDGTLQGLLALAGVPYVGAGVAASAIGMDKALMKRIFRQAGLDVVDHLVVRLSEYKAGAREIGDAVEASIGYPAFVKPANGGSSVGISKVRSREDLGPAVCLAFRYDRKLLVERAVEAREVECAVLGNDDPKASPLGEIRYTREFYDYEAKYLDPGTQLIVPAELPQETAQRIQELAVRGYRAIDCAGMGRMDFFLAQDGQVYIDEINTVPGFTPGSMYPLLWQHAGLSYGDLIGRLVELALERHKERVRG